METDETRNRLTLLRGTLRAFDVGTYLATVEIVGSRAQYLAGVPVSRGIPAAEVVAGRRAVVVFFEGNNPDDAMVVGVW